MGTGTHTATGTGEPGTHGLRMPMSHGWGPGIPAHTGKGPRTPIMWEWRLGTLVHAGRRLKIPMAQRWGPGTPAHADRGPRTPMPWGQELGTAAHAELGPKTLLPWGQGMGTSAHAGRGLGTPVPWGQLTPSVPAPGTPQERFFGTQTQSTTMCPRAIMPSLFPVGPAKAPKEKPKCWGHTHFAFPRSHRLLFGATFPP